MRKLLMLTTALLTGASMAACKPDPSGPRPMKSAVQPAPSPSWAIGMDPGCLTTREQVAIECLEGGAPQCRNNGNQRPCWFVDPSDGQVWYRP